MDIGGLDHIVLRTADARRLQSFYCTVLGCSVEREVVELGLIQLRAGAALIDIVPVDGELGAKGGAAPAAEGRNLDHFCLWLAQFDEAAIRTHLRACGIQAPAAARRYGAQGFGPSIYIEDPDGNTVELKGPAQ
ncbi:MAG: VOC family protein [Gammaproteobacteria bacterium]|nr:VOC family protein [Gammaproteobacteria bacterium]